jgi:hypothetical protein
LSDELLKDPYVIGCCLYQLGGAENFAKLLPLLADTISVTPTPVIPVPVEPPAPVGEKYRIACDRLNVRVEPSVFSTVRASLRRNDIVTVLEKKIAGIYEWGRIEKGWIALRQIIEPLAEKI